MCGINGIFGVDDLTKIRDMNDLMDYRGPDDSGEYFDHSNRVTIAMRRLAIVDLAYGAQPMSNFDETIWIVFNGEIFNAPENRIFLEKKGYKFKTRNSDTEVLIHLYEEFGTALLDRLNGMFAFVIYDRKKKVLFGARDHAGIKPLYFSRKDGKFAFSSELKCLLTLPWISREINSKSLSSYLSLQYIPSPYSIFWDVQKLSPGSFFTFFLDQKLLSIESYWNPDFQNSYKGSYNDCKADIRSEMEAAVKRWTMSDVPLACSLSGGLDSSAITALACKTGNRIDTYSVGFDNVKEQEFNELPLASLISKKYNTRHHQIIVNSDDVLDDLDRMVWHLDEPYGGGLPSWYIYKLACKDLKVILSGTGGDELFGNYNKFIPYQKGLLYRIAKTVSVTGKVHSFNGYKDAILYPHGHFYPRYFSDSIIKRVLLSPYEKEHYSTESLLEGLWRDSGSKDARDAIAFIDFKLQLPEEFLHVTDRFSMAHSVEARVPFLDRKLIEKVFSLSSDIRVNRSNGYKTFLKDLIKDIVPEEILNSKKRGFMLPLRLWTRNQLKSRILDLLNPNYLKSQGIFSNSVYYKIVQPHLSHNRDFTPHVWTLFMFQLWYNKFILNK